MKKIRLMKEKQIHLLEENMNIEIDSIVSEGNIIDSVRFLMKSSDMFYGEIVYIEIKEQNN